MKRWMKWVLVAAVMSLPAAGWAVSKINASHDGCPMDPDCPCLGGKAK
jgi:hypothetical protein